MAASWLGGYVGMTWPRSRRTFIACSSRSLVKPITSRLRPILRPVEDARDFNGMLRDVINDDVGQGWKYQFAASGHTNARASKVGEILQRATTVINGPRNAPRCFGLSRSMRSQMRSKSSAARCGPSNIHQFFRNRSRRWPTHRKAGCRGAKCRNTSQRKSSELSRESRRRT